MADEPIIRVENFTAAYDGKTVIDDISFDVKRGEVFVILGGSGCGKSTLLKHMIGLYEPQGGHMFIDGDDIVVAEGDARRGFGHHPARRRRRGVRRHLLRARHLRP